MGPIPRTAWYVDRWTIDDVTVAEQSTGSGGYPFFDDMEDGPKGWQPGGQWTLVTGDAHSDAYAWDLNPGDEYQRNTDFSLELAEYITVPVDAARPELSYYDHFDLGSDTTLGVEVSTDDGQTWVFLQTFDASGNCPDWVLRRIPLDGYAGQTILLRFRAVQGGDWYVDRWTIDDVRVGDRVTPAAVEMPFSDDMESGAGH